MPLQYSGIIQEHQAVRSEAGLFDVSHMGEIMVEGKAAGEFIQRLITNDISRLKDSQVLILLCAILMAERWMTF